MRVVEIFSSIEGEGNLAGLSTLFIRLFGCNLRCEWCDTTHSYEPLGRYNDQSIAKLVEIASSHSSSMITITGGEPFMHSELPELCKELLPLKRTIKIETNGTIFLDLPKEIYLCVSPKPPRYTVDPKILQSADEMKFVVDDHLTIKTVIDINYKGKIVLQLESNKNESLDKALELQKELIERGIHSKVLPQLHKLINLA
ncbi:7-carboxy-7-deazaguanine synthase [Campylobacterota bacterium]|nr:7-carboxy-7-deazaguanine synthase [Campylobacterota bacterium]